MSTDLDRLDLELRSIPGVISVAFEERPGDRLFIQVVALQPSDELAHLVRRVIGADVRELVSLELVDIDLSPTRLDLRPSS